jgi:hypothetical protein
MGYSSIGRPTTGRIRNLLTPDLERRQFLEVVADAGFGLGMARHLSIDDFLSAPRDEVPIVYGYARQDPDDPTSLVSRTTTVPAEWYDRLQRALTVHQELLQTDAPGLVRSFVDPGPPGGDVSIDARITEADARAEVADLLEDVSTEVTEIDGIPDLDLDDLVPPDVDGLSPAGSEKLDRTPAYVEDVSDSAVEGGVACEGSAGLGTLAPAMYDPETGSRFFATSNHLYGESGTKRTEHRGGPLSLVGRDRRETVGTIRRGYPAEDFVRVDPVDDYRPRSRIHGADPRRVIGQFTKFGLAALKARGERLRKFGAVSRRTSGKIKGIDGITCFTGKVCKVGQLKWGDEEALTDGDSGSVSYHPDPDSPEESVMVAGINNARTWWPGSDYTWGTAAHHIYDTYGYTF